jgi:hypothetical protein
MSLFAMYPWHRMTTAPLLLVLTVPSAACLYSPTRRSPLGLVNSMRSVDSMEEDGRGDVGGKLLGRFLEKAAMYRRDGGIQVV